MSTNSSTILQTQMKVRIFGLCQELIQKRKLRTINYRKLLIEIGDISNDFWIENLIYSLKMLIFNEQSLHFENENTQPYSSCKLIYYPLSNICIMLKWTFNICSSVIWRMDRKLNFLRSIKFLGNQCNKRNLL